MPAVKNLIHETSTTIGTGSFTVSAVNGKVRFSNGTYGFGTGGTDVFDYFTSNRDAAEWEYGTGHMSDANTLVRDTVIAGSNGASPVNFSAGTKDITNDIPAERQFIVDAAMSLTATQQQTARSNIYAAPFDALAYNGMQINGGVSVSQELGTTGATLTNNTAKYTADMWEALYNHGAATAVVTSGQIAAASFGAVLSGFTHGHRIKATTAISSIANGDIGVHRCKIEGWRTARLGWGASGAQSISIALRFYAMRTGTQMLRVSNNAGNRFYHTDFSVVAGWNFITKTIPGDTSGTWIKDSTGVGLIVGIYGAGKDSTAAPAGWGATGYLATSGSNGVNQYSSNNDETVVTGLVILPGTELLSSDRLPLTMRPFPHELELAKRYWQKSYKYADPAGTTNNDGVEIFRCNTGAHHNNAIFCPYMATSPAVTLYSPGSGSSGSWRDIDAGVDRTATVGASTERSFRAAISSGVDGNLVSGHWIANARL